MSSIERHLFVGRRFFFFAENQLRNKLYRVERKKTFRSLLRTFFLFSLLLFLYFNVQTTNDLIISLYEGEKIFFYRFLLEQNNFLFLQFQRLDGFVNIYRSAHQIYTVGRDSNGRYDRNCVKRGDILQTLNITLWARMSQPNVVFHRIECSNIQIQMKKKAIRLMFARSILYKNSVFVACFVVFLFTHLFSCLLFRLLRLCRIVSLPGTKWKAWEDFDLPFSHSFSTLLNTIQCDWIC